MNNDSATFFDIHRRPDKQENLQLGLEEFLSKVKAGQLFDTDTASIECPALPAADKALVSDSNDWINLEVALVWALSGKIADKETIYPYRDAYRTLLKNFGIQNSFKLSVLVAYMVCALRLKRNGWGAEDKNNVDDFKEFFKHLLDPDKTMINITTFMCAHREADEEDANKLVKKLKTESFVRIINLLKSIVYNLDSKNIELTIYHLDDSKHSLLAIFPNIIFEYLESEGLGKLLKTLGKHYKEIEALAKKLSDEKLVISLAPSKAHIIETRELCEEFGGKEWRSLTPFQASSILPNKDLHEITEESAIAEVDRYMPEYGSVKVKSIRSDTNTEDSEIMKWYVEQESLSPYAKAMYESLFYFNWGQKTKKNDGIAIGIDRDHSDFQVRAFHTGYNGSYAFGSTAPVVYLRRSDREIGKHDVHALSLRQFWRYSDDHKR